VNGWADGDTQQMLDMLRRYGEAPWFGLGDRDMATNLLRTEALAAGRSLSEVTAWLCGALGIQNRLLPMTDDQVATVVETVEYGTLDFQEYFVRYRWQPAIRALRYEGSEQARPAPGVLDAIASASVLVICPSNPLLSAEPILRVPGIREAIERRKVPCVAVSPIIVGAALKGPAAKLMAELGYEASAAGVAAYYGSLIDGFVADVEDRHLAIRQKVLATNIRMNTVEDRGRLAGEILEWIRIL
jgi:LPPG:FO 2-phospho-L-lactate transferase